MPSLAQLERLFVEPDKVRHSIGLTGQYAPVDELLTGRENLVLMGQLYRE